MRCWGCYGVCFGVGFRVGVGIRGGCALSCQWGCEYVAMWFLDVGKEGTHEMIGLGFVVQRVK